MLRALAGAAIGRALARGAKAMENRRGEAPETRAIIGADPTEVGTKEVPAEVALAGGEKGE